jgi:hypothetical protein
VERVKWLTSVIARGPDVNLWQETLMIVLAIMLVLQSAADKPAMPFSDPGACPFECCQYGIWTAKQTVSLRKERNKQSPVVFTISRGEKVTATTGVVVTYKPGVVRMLKQSQFETVRVPAGAVVYVLHYGGEGSDLFWYNGKTHWGELFAESVHKGNTEYPWDVDSLPVTEWWVQVKTSRGVTGWILMPANFDGTDACA